MPAHFAETREDFVCALNERLERTLLADSGIFQKLLEGRSHLSIFERGEKPLEFLADLGLSLQTL
ncbi:MAG: hypothetical protein AAGA58_01295 [Verrucomicrobiota bacterium]